MPAFVDHVLVCTAVGAPAAEHLMEFGPVEDRRTNTQGRVRLAVASSFATQP
jgi:hypothetical protein